MILKLTIFFVALAALAACNLDEPRLPIAGFSADSSGCFAPCRVTFKDLSQNTSVYIWTYSWWFKDSSGAFAVIPNPAYDFKKPGEYTVLMSISNPVYGGDTTEQAIIIKKKL